MAIRSQPRFLASALAVALIVISAAASAQAPPLVPVQGALYDSEGAPVDGSVAVDFVLYDSPTSLDPVWSEGQRLLFDNGLFTAYLGQETELDLALFAESRSLWLGISVGGDPEMERIEIATSPYAGFAQYCDDASTLAGLDPDALVAGAVGEAPGHTKLVNAGSSRAR